MTGEKLFSLVPVQDRQKMTELYKKYQLPLPDDFREIHTTQMLVGKFLKGSQVIGMAAGSFRESEGLFEILMFYIERAERTTALVCMVIEQLMKLAEEQFHPAEIGWKYEVVDKERDPYLRLVQKIPGYVVSVQEISETNRIYTDEFLSYRHSLSVYSIETLEERGFQVCTWKECDEQVKQQFQKLQETDDEELAGLLPFVGEDYDEETSLVLYQKETHEICSWIICNRISADEVEFRRWYTMEKYRSSGNALIFGAYVLQLLGRKCRMIRVLMKDDNKSMKGFINRYFRKLCNAKIERSFKRYMRIKEDKNELDTERNG